MTPRRALRWSPLALLAVAALVAAGHTPVGPCGSDGDPALGLLEVRSHVPGGSGLFGPNEDGAFYVDDRNYVSGNGVRLYEESNGLYSPDSDAAHNVQRGGCAWLDFAMCESRDRCTDDAYVLPDSLLW